MTDTDASNRVLVALRETRYASPQMAERRARILETARQLFARDDGTFTMRALARESGVSTSTLYKSFGSQEDLIAQAVIEIFVDRIVPVETGKKISPFDRLKQQLTLSSKEVLRAPAHARKMIGIYFSSDGNTAIRQILHRYSYRFYRRILNDLDTAGALADHVNKEILADELTVVNYAIVARWAVGEIDDDSMTNRQVHACLTQLLGALKPKSATEARARMKALKVIASTGSA